MITSFGKGTVQNILVFRFANRFIEPVLHIKHGDEVQIAVAETLGVEGRLRVASTVDRVT